MFTVDCQALACTFDASQSRAPDANASYRWTLGNGNTTQGQTTNHTYAATGTYPVHLDLSHPEAGSDNVTKTLTFNEEPTGQNISQDAVQDRSLGSASDLRTVPAADGIALVAMLASAVVLPRRRR